MWGCARLLCTSFDNTWALSVEIQSADIRKWLIRVRGGLTWFHLHTSSWFYGDWAWRKPRSLSNYPFSCVTVLFKGMALTEPLAQLQYTCQESNSAVSERADQQLQSCNPTTNMPSKPLMCIKKRKLLKNIAYVLLMLLPVYLIWMWGHAIAQPSCCVQPKCWLQDSLSSQLETSMKSHTGQKLNI